MGLLRREVMSPVSGWRKPHTLAGLFFATLLFATSLDALLLSYRLRMAEFERGSLPAPAMTRSAALEHEVDALIREQQRLMRQLARERRLAERAIAVELVTDPTTDRK